MKADSINECYDILFFLLNKFSKLEVVENFTKVMQKLMKFETLIPETILQIFFSVLKSSKHTDMIKKVLRCINMKIIYPFVFELRNVVWQKFQYKEIKGSLRTKIRVNNNNSVTTTIYRKEMVKNKKRKIKINKNKK